MPSEAWKKNCFHWQKASSCMKLTRIFLYFVVVVLVGRLRKNYKQGGTCEHPAQCGCKQQVLHRSHEGSGLYWDDGLV